MKHPRLKSVGFLLLVATSPVCVFAQNPAAQREAAGWDAFNKAMGEKFQACADEGRSGCANAMLPEWEKELNVVYKKLMAELDSAQQNSLRSAQRAWLAFREKEVAFLDGRVDVMMEGTIAKDQSDLSVLDITQSRVEALHAYLMAELYRDEEY